MASPLHHICVYRGVRNGNSAARVRLCGVHDNAFVYLQICVPVDNRLRVCVCVCMRGHSCGKTVLESDGILVDPHFFTWLLEGLELR